MSIYTPPSPNLVLTNTYNLTNVAPSYNSYTLSVTRSYELLVVTTNHPVRIRLYTTSALQTGDLARPSTVPATRTLGLLWEGITTSTSLTILCNPIPLCTNLDTLSTNTYCTIDSTTSLTTLALTLTYIQLN